MATVTAAVFGSTGGAGSQILAAALASNAFSSVKTISRRLPSAESPNLESLLEADIDKWEPMIAKLSPKPDVIFHAVGTRAQTGGLKNQWHVDHDSVIAQARAAKQAGTTTFVFMSCGGIRSWPMRLSPYAKMKNGVEDAIWDMGFEHAIMLRPGMIFGEKTLKSAFFESTAKALKVFGQGVQDSIAVDHIVLGRAAVAAASAALEGKAPSNYWILEQADLVRLGRDEWTE